MIMLVKMDVRRMLITIEGGCFKDLFLSGNSFLREMKECEFCFWRFEGLENLGLRVALGLACFG